MADLKDHRLVPPLTGADELDDEAVDEESAQLVESADELADDDTAVEA